VIQEQASILLIDSESSVKRALLANITCLCVFFGRQKANDILLSHMITYLNDKDWMLRRYFIYTFSRHILIEEYKVRFLKALKEWVLL
jgi:phosphoinositide-3-kinase regulatory subunit 4